MNDTSQDIMKRYSTMVLTRTPLERLKMASRMYDSGKKLAIAGILKENGTLSQFQLRMRLFLRIYGTDYTTSDVKKIASKIPNIHC